jgi:hypothetical protein
LTRARPAIHEKYWQALEVYVGFGGNESRCPDRQRATSRLAERKANHAHGVGGTAKNLWITDAELVGVQFNVLEVGEREGNDIGFGSQERVLDPEAPRRVVERLDLLHPLAEALCPIVDDLDFVRG